MKSLAVIGFGGRASDLTSRLVQLDPEIRLAAIADPNLDGARATLEEKFPAADVRLYPSIDHLLESGEEYDGFIIGTRCHMHTPLAARIAPLNKPVLMEKPVSTSWEQLRELQQAYQGRESTVVVSFPLRLTPLFTAAVEVIREGRLGRINQIQAWNNVGYGGVYFAKWYRNYEQVGGLWLQKATHDFDFINILANSTPQTIAAMSNRMAMGGDKPFDLTCANCRLRENCIESPPNLAARGDHGGMGWKDHYCVFSEGIQNQDSGSALIQYANGIQACYAQNFITRRSAESRGARITGYKATLKFDWYTSKIRIVDHHRNRVDTIQVQATTSHLGGDEVLLQEFIGVLRDGTPSQVSLQDGVLSAAMCLAARESCRTHTFQPICVPGMREFAKERHALTLVEP